MDSFKQKLQETKWLSWAIKPEELKKSKQFFDKLDEDHDGYISGSQAKKIFAKTNLPNDVLGKIWTLSDVDKDNRLNWKEYALALFLIGAKLKGETLPNNLPENLYDSVFNEHSSPRAPKNVHPSGVQSQRLSSPPYQRNAEDQWKVTSAVVYPTSPPPPPPPSVNDDDIQPTYRTAPQVLNDKRKSSPPTNYGSMPNAVPEPLVNPYASPVRVEDFTYGSVIPLTQAQLTTFNQANQTQNQTLNQPPVPSRDPSQLQKEENILNNPHINSSKEIVLLAISEDARGDHAKAILLYQQAIEGFEKGLKELVVPLNKQIVKREIDKYTIRVEQLYLKLGIGQPPQPVWTEHKTPEGKLYYYNASTGLTQWQRPQNFPY